MCKARNGQSRLRTSFCIIILFLLLPVLMCDVFGAEAPQVAVETKLVETKSDDASSIFDLSIEQLMDVGVFAAATITEKNPLKTPASVTTITAADIARTPARNILDLIEIYVPGAMYMNHSIGPTFGIRGFIADRPYKYLVNVNGMNVNIKAHYGARLELLNWELSDIDRIEVVRGPGSVTYGPGAIGGVINIYTKKGKQAPGWEYGGHYWGKYDSLANYISYGKSKDQFDLYAYFSVVRTQGTRPDIYAVSSSASGYLGSSGLQSGRPPSTYMADYRGEPEIKAHLDIRFNDEWRFWGRYVTSSFELMTDAATKYPDIFDGDNEDFRQDVHRYFQFALENHRTLSPSWDLKSTYGVSSIDTVNIEKYTTGNGDRDSLVNMKWTWSEWEYFARFMLNYKPEGGNIKAAIGYEVSWLCIRPAWGKNKDNGLRMGTRGIISGPTSDAYGSSSGSSNKVNESYSGGYYEAGIGWDTVTHSFLSELNIALTPKTTMIFSARVDKHSYTGYELSPRAAFIYEVSKNEYWKLIAQRSVRMNTEDELWMNKKSGIENDPETLETFELIYTKKYTKNLSFQGSAFLSKNESIAWNGSTGASPVGLLRTFGLELELLYKKENWELGVNHSYTKQLSWENADGITKQGISYSDFSDPISNGGEIRSAGNDLSNWHNHATKLFTNIDMFKKKVTLHGDVMVFWGMEGERAGFDAMYNASANSGNSYSTLFEDVKRRKPFNTEARGNMSLTYHLDSFADVIFFLENIQIIGENKRFAYNSGNKDAYPNKTTWVEEPMVVGVRYKVRF